MEVDEYISKAERDKVADADFAGPSRSFPIRNQTDVDNAARLIGHADDPEAVKRRIIAIAKRKGLSIPDAWKDEKQESAGARPAKKIATLKVCFLEDGARSLNGRIYPKSTCQKILASGQAKLANPQALPMTVFVSHETANQNVNTELVGRVVRLWQEGAKYYANLDLADTRVARDMLALAEGGYMRSESMRVLGVELLHDRNYDLPLVVPQEGVEPELLGIDLTTRPGLMDSARIQQVLYESQEAQTPYTEELALVDDVCIESKEVSSAVTIPLYLKILAEAAPTGTPALLTEGMTPDRAAHQRIHDHLAGVLDETVKAMHGSESARYRALVEAELSEEGRALAKKHAKRLALAHDESARAMGMDCEGAYHEALGIVDPDQDGDDDSVPGGPLDTDNDGGQPADQDEPKNSDGESQKGQHMELTEAQMVEALKAKGFAIEAPKTPEQLFQETLEAKLAEQERKFNERLAQLTGTNDPQRQTLALGSGLEESSLQPESLYQEGDYLQGELSPKNWRALSDRRVPWPAGLDPKLALQEMAPFLAYRLNADEAAARGRHISQFIGADELV